MDFRRIRARGEDDGIADFVDIQVESLILAEMVGYTTRREKDGAVGSSPLTWVRLCGHIHHLTEGMVAGRLATDGHTTNEIHTMTGISVLRIAAIKVVPTTALTR
jgi:hypothetical protein